jgi:hypothetical protein
VNGWTESIVRIICDPAWHEEILGDLAELRTRDLHSATFTRRVRELRELTSILLRCRRRRRMRTAVIATATVLAIATALGTMRTTRITIAATDDAGDFTLDFAGRAVIAATVDGAPLTKDRITQVDDTVRLHGANHGGDLVIHIADQGAIKWTSRRPR